MSNKDFEKVGRKEIAKNISHVEGISETAADRIVDQVFKHIMYTIVHKKVVDIPKFGKFYGKYIPKRKGSHPQSHEEIEIDDRVQLRLECSSSLKKYLKQYVEDFRE